MSTPDLQRRIFLVGVPRSGTTLLQALLAAHPEVTSFTESHLFSRHFSAVPGVGMVLSKDPTPRLRAFLEENDAAPPTAADWFGPPPPKALRSRALMPPATREVARRLVAVLDGLARDRGAATWLEKTPRHLRAIPLLEAVCDDGIPTHFVHLVRDGLQTVASLHTASRNWEQAYDLDDCVRRWNQDLALTRKHLDSPRHHLVCYETLTTDPVTVLRPLLEALNLPWDPTILDDFGASAGAVTAPGENWKAGVARDIRPSATAERVLSEAERDRVRARLDQGLYDSLVVRAIGNGHHGPSHE